MSLQVADVNLLRLSDSLQTAKDKAIILCRRVSRGMAEAKVGGLCGGKNILRKRERCTRSSSQLLRDIVFLDESFQEKIVL